LERTDSSTWGDGPYRVDSLWKRVWGKIHQKTHIGGRREPGYQRRGKEEGRDALKEGALSQYLTICQQGEGAKGSDGEETLKDKADSQKKTVSSKERKTGGAKGGGH